MLRSNLAASKQALLLDKTSRADYNFFYESYGTNPFIQ
jgi:hypothetical protein